MKVFKFGGASVKNASAVKNVANIIGLFPDDQLMVVISAMGKTTNGLEELNRLIFNKDPKATEKLEEIKTFHLQIMKQLFPQRYESVFQDVMEVFEELNHCIHRQVEYSFDHQYDQIVSKGEMISTKIVTAYLQETGVNASWLDVRNVIQTDHTHREGNVNWEATQQHVTKNVLPLFAGHSDKVLVTQGFIGVSPEGFTTTLGREGSDYTASILAHCLNAKDVTIWKDVPGVLNADPKWFDNTVKLNNLTYQDAIELAYYGASVIHPKTIQPLQNKDIPLHVKSFVDPSLSGTVIGEGSYDSLIPSFIFKMDQVLFSIASKDFSFIAEDHLQTIFTAFAKRGVKINLMQNSAISFLVCMNNDPEKVKSIEEELGTLFKIKHEEGLELITIRYYDSATIERVSKNKDIILQQKGKRTIQLVVKDLGNGLTI